MVKCFDTTLLGNYFEYKALLGNYFEHKMPVTRRAKYKAKDSTTWVGRFKSVDSPNEPVQAKEAPTASPLLTK